ncbi:hypothetical protein Pyn_01847 [Prunus yedoensis var. nudiflora]|uniref:Uncharacterized protein n=1 Tax=Prunus yedoensis var. nudiflora TaxID=2094558 RepID=A0A314USP8_PRUYE|nr:hypothetical protein Pyn_01847 [Prunus yedoensis var. nudiflora]
MPASTAAFPRWPGTPPSPRGHHAVVTQAQRHRIGAHVHALNVLPRYVPKQTVVVQKQALHPGQDRRQLTRYGVVAQIHDRALAVGWGWTPRVGPTRRDCSVATLKTGGWYGTEFEGGVH